jgi:hypothetical protein
VAAQTWMDLALERPHGGAPGGRGPFFDSFGRPIFCLDVVRLMIWKEGIVSIWEKLGPRNWYRHTILRHEECLRCLTLMINC